MSIPENAYGSGPQSVVAQTALQLVVEAHTATGLGEDLTYFEHAIWFSQSRPSQRLTIDDGVGVARFTPVHQQ